MLDFVSSIHNLKDFVSFIHNLKNIMSALSFRIYVTDFSSICNLKTVFLGLRQFYPQPQRLRQFHPQPQKHLRQFYLHNLNMSALSFRIYVTDFKQCFELTTSASTTSKQCFEQPEASFLVAL
ncbi:Uncharacterised protein [Streptococcus pneumoniae]|nr:Uncharacterised protein [Streptococcus pneumoniae]